jgi:peptidyl-prolyl cis-trans isomerase D
VTIPPSRRSERPPSIAQKFDVALLRNSGHQSPTMIISRNAAKVAVRSQIVDAVSNGFVAAEDAWSMPMKQYRQESRGIDYLLLTNANIDPIKAPAEDVLCKVVRRRQAALPRARISQDSPI